MPLTSRRSLSARTGRELWRQRVEASPNAPFLTDPGSAATYAQSDDRIRRVAAGLAELNVKAGDRVAVALPNSASAVWIHGALRELQAVMVPLVPGLTFAEQTFQLDHSQATTLIAGGPQAAGLLPRTAELPRIGTTVNVAVDEQGEDLSLPADATLAELLTRDPRSPVKERAGAEDQPWAIFYTSGSTGRPKGVQLPAGAFVSGGWGYAERFALTDADSYVVATPMAHAVGGLTQPSGAMHVGGSLAILDHFSPSKFWVQVAEAGGTVAILFAAQLNLLLTLEAEGPPCGETPLRLVITHVMHDDFRERFGVEVGVCWGMTETGAGSTGSPPHYRGEFGDGYVGSAMEGVEVAIMNERREPQPVGVEGEICLRTRYQMTGYLDDPEATERTLIDGWVHSGDNGMLDADGRLFFRGRIKNMIKRAGENISPVELELAISKHPAVSEVIVLAVPDPIRTEEVAAVVVRRAGMELEGSELNDFLGAEVAAWKLPRYIELRDKPLPRLAAGKLDSHTVLAELSLADCWDRHSPRETVARMLGATVTEWGQLVAGNSRTTWAARARRGQTNLAVIVRADDGDGPFSGTPLTLAREASMYKALQGRGLPLPAFHGFDKARNLVVLERVQGTPEWNQEVLAALLTTLRELHAIDTDSIDLPGVGRSSRDELELWAQMAASRITPPSPYVDFAFEFLRARFPGEPPKLAVVHGDPGVGNLLWQDGQISALLDWEMAHFGDPMDDLAFLTVRAAMFGIDLGDFAGAVQASYGPTGPAEEARLHYWQAVSVLRNLTICLSSVRNPVRGRERLVHWMLIPSLNRLLMRSLAKLEGTPLAPPMPAPTLPPLPGAEVLSEIASELERMTPLIDDPDGRQRARRARYLIAQLTQTWQLAPQIAEQSSVDRPGASTALRLQELAADADRELWLFPRARGLGEADLPTFTAR